LRDYSNRTPLHCAAGNGYQDIANILIQKGAKVDMQDMEGRAALHYATGCENFAIIESLFPKNDTGVHTVQIKDNDDQKAFHFAAKRGHEKEARVMIEIVSQESRLLYAGGPDMKDRTTIHFAAGYGSEEMVRTLLHYKIDPNVCGENKWTVLHYATRGKRSG
jgi:ankyrin repeat protein